MDRGKQRGEGRLGAIMGLLAVGALVYAGINAGPAYFAHYEFKDHMIEAARIPRSTGGTDEKVLDQLEKYARQDGLGDWVRRDNLKVITRDNSRTVSVRYERPVKYLPGFERIEVFETSVDVTVLF